MELWKDVKGYEGLYQVSNQGRVKSLRKMSGSCYRKERILKTQTRLTKDGYCRASLNRHGKARDVRVNRLVAEIFLPNPENKPTVNHKNGIKSDNRVENLEWETREENMQHAYDNRLKVSSAGSGNVHSKLTDEDVREIRKIYKRYSKEFGTVALAKRFNVTHRVINLIINNKSYKNVY
jgi:NUMOD4 motif/HNH endonuclease